MKHLRFKYVIALLFTTSISAFAQVEVGNGGDLIRCTPDTRNNFDGVYTLDYVATFDQNVTYLAPDIQDPLALITKTIQRTPLGPEFKTFRENYAAQMATKQPNYFLRNVWKPVALGFIDLNDSFLYEALPDNCKTTDGAPKLIQTVIHEARSNAFIYSYDPNALSLVDDRALQKSMILVHEFLWRVAPNARVLRDANRFFHEEATSQMTPKMLVDSLTNIGLVMDYQTIPQPLYKFSIDSSKVEDINFGEITVFWEIGFDLYFDNRADDYFELKLYIEDYANPGKFVVARDFSTAPRNSGYGPPYAKLFGRLPGYVTIQRFKLDIANGIPSLTPSGPEHRVLTLNDPE